MFVSGVARQVRLSKNGGRDLGREQLQAAVGKALELFPTSRIRELHVERSEAYALVVFDLARTPGEVDREVREAEASIAAAIAAAAPSAPTGAAAEDAQQHAAEDVPKAEQPAAEEPQAKARRGPSRPPDSPTRSER